MMMMIHRRRRNIYVTIIWLSPPTWISKNCCHFFAIWPIVTKFFENNVTSIWNICMTSQMHNFTNSRWRSPPSWISKNCCFSLLIDRSSSNLVQILRRWFGAYWRCLKCIVAKSQHGSHRHLEFRKTVSIFLLFDQSPPKLVGIWLLWFRTHR